MSALVALRIEAFRTAEKSVETGAQQRSAALSCGGDDSCTTRRTVSALFSRLLRPLASIPPCQQQCAQQLIYAMLITVCAVAKEKPLLLPLWTPVELILLNTYIFYTQLSTLYTIASIILHPPNYTYPLGRKPPDRVLYKSKRFACFFPRKHQKSQTTRSTLPPLLPLSVLVSFSQITHHTSHTPRKTIKLI